MVLPDSSEVKENQDMEQPMKVNNPNALETDVKPPGVETFNLENATISEREEAFKPPTDTNEVDVRSPGVETVNLENATIYEREEAFKPPTDTNEVDLSTVQKDEPEETNASEDQKLDTQPVNDLEEDATNLHNEIHVESLSEIKSLHITEKTEEIESESDDADSRVDTNIDQVSDQEEEEPVFDGTEVPEIEANGISAWPEKAVALTNLVRQKSLIAMSSVIRRLSGKSDDGDATDEDKNGSKDDVNNEDSSPKMEVQGVSQKSSWNPLSLIGLSSGEEETYVEDLTEPVFMKGRIILYTRLGCQISKEARRYLQHKRLRYVEINIDVYPTRKLELEKISGSCDVPKVFFNEVLIGGLGEMKSLEESGKLAEKIEYVVSETPSFEAPMPPLSGEDDLSSSGAIDELALIVRKMKESVIVRDRFCKMRRYTNCFVGSEAVDFLSEDQYLERDAAVEFGRKLANNLFLRHVADENVFEDGNHLYRFLDDDPLISQCQNIPRGISEVKPKAITEISSRLRFLVYAILEGYTSEDGKHVDYRSIHGSEEFARYLRIVEELQRVELSDMSREEKLAFFINLYNMMAIHGILMWGHPSGALERRRFYGDFKYVIGGSTYSLSAIYNGILRGNQRPPYNLVKPFGMDDNRLKVALPYTEPLIHFALVSGTRSGPALRCYSPADVDKEMVEAASSFIRTGGLYVDAIANVAYVNTIFKWYSSDFGKDEMEVLKHAANYLEADESQGLLELLANVQLKVIYQPYDWGLNH